MSEAIKPTPGEWRFYTEPQPNGCPIVGNDKGVMVAMVAHSVNYPDQKETALGDARLITDAGTVFHTTGLTPSQLVERVKELEEALTLADLLLSGANMNRANVELKVRAALSKARPNTAEGEAHADNVLEDSARWHEVLNHVGADNLLGGAQYVLRGIQAPVNVMQGSVAQHFTKSIDAVRKQAAAKEPSP